MDLLAFCVFSEKKIHPGLHHPRRHWERRESHFSQILEKVKEFCIFGSQHIDWHPGLIESVRQYVVPRPCRFVMCSPHVVVAVCRRIHDRENGLRRERGDNNFAEDSAGSDAWTEKGWPRRYPHCPRVRPRAVKGYTPQRPFDNSGVVFHFYVSSHSPAGPPEACF